MDRARDRDRGRDSRAPVWALAMIRAQDVPAEEGNRELAMLELAQELLIDPRYTVCVSQSTRAMDSTKRKVIK